MSLRIQTLDGYEIFAGYNGPNLDVISIGDLDPMLTPQFIGFATMTLIENVIPMADDETRQNWLKLNMAVRNRVRDMAVRNTEITNHDSIIDEEIDDQIDFKPVRDYQVNPFQVYPHGKSVSLEGFHVIKSTNFFVLTARVINGGFHGWGEGGTFQEVKNATERLHQALSE